MLIIFVWCYKSFPPYLFFLFFFSEKAVALLSCCYITQKCIYDKKATFYKVQDCYKTVWKRRKNSKKGTFLNSVYVTMFLCHQLTICLTVWQNKAVICLIPLFPVSVNSFLLSNTVSEHLSIRLHSKSRANH